VGELRPERPKEPERARSGDPRYRALVGPPLDYDLIAGLQFTLLFYAGLRQEDTLLDVGCGSLRGGRLFIPYLDPGNYHGVEPNEWLVEEGLNWELGRDILDIKRPTFSAIADFSLGSLGVRFDFVLAQSILSHTFDDLTPQALAGMRDALADEGVLVATFVEDDGPRSGSGWSYPDPVPYTWAEMRALAERAGLAVRRLAWPHPRQTWFIGAHGDDRVAEIEGLVENGYPRMSVRRPRTRQ
jgi:SAM-dependent methyltransferase